MTAVNRAVRLHKDPALEDDGKDEHSDSGIENRIHGHDHAAHASAADVHDQEERLHAGEQRRPQLLASEQSCLKTL